MSSLKNTFKRANSKSKLAAAVVFYQRALSHYANESNWAVKGDDIIWLGDDDPTYAAALSLGRRQVDPNYKVNQKTNVREPDKKSTAPDEYPEEAIKHITEGTNES